MTPIASRVISFREIFPGAVSSYPKQASRKKKKRQEKKKKKKKREGIETPFPTRENRIFQCDICRHRQLAQFIYFHGLI